MIGEAVTVIDVVATIAFIAHTPAYIEVKTPDSFNIEEGDIDE